MKAIRYSFTWLLPLLLVACFQVELGGPVPGASITITELRSGIVVEDGLTSLDEAGFIARRSQEKWDALKDIGRLINLGNFFADKDLYEENALYLITVSGGEDMDANSDRLEDPSYTPVNGTWHAIVAGAQLRSGGHVVSPITEALFQSLRDEIAQLTDAQILARLDSATASILRDANDDGTVNYLDALAWTVLFDIGKYKLDYDDVRELANAITEGRSEQDIRERFLKVLGEEPVDALQFFTDNISMPIVQSKCVNCHTASGIAPARGARLVLVTNSNGNHLNINHQAFIDLEAALGSRDLSDYVTAKASAQISHGGGRQLAVGSVDLLNLETYLNMLE